VRLKALETLQNVLEDHGSLFSAQAWLLIYRGILFPIMESAKLDDTDAVVSDWPSEHVNDIPDTTDDGSWVSTMSTPVFNFLIKIHHMHKSRYDEVTLLRDLMSLLGDCLCQEKESLIKFALKATYDLIRSLTTEDDEGDVGKAPKKEIVEIIVQILCRCFKDNLCLDFGPDFVLQLSVSGPERMQTFLKSCPVISRNTRASGNSSMSDSDKMKSPMKEMDAKAVASSAATVRTPYGTGSVLSTREEKRIIQLPWGTLYTFEPYETMSAESMELTSLRDSGFASVDTDFEFEDYHAPIMASMVATLGLVVMVDVVVDRFFTWFNQAQLTNLLELLETVHWHARSFNEDQALRHYLKDLRFMVFKHSPGRSPNLLEQEVKSMKAIVAIGTRMLKATDYERTAIPWLEKYCLLSCSRHMELDQTIVTGSPAAADLLVAYKPAILAMLNSLANASQEHFNLFLTPLGETFAKLIVCQDRDIRVKLSEIFEHKVLPIVEKRPG
jgi:hypothetical protein